MNVEYEAYSSVRNCCNGKSSGGGTHAIGRVIGHGSER